MSFLYGTINLIVFSFHTQLANFIVLFSYRAKFIEKEVLINQCLFIIIISIIVIVIRTFTIIVTIIIRFDYRILAFCFHYFVIHILGLNTISYICQLAIFSQYL